MFVKLMYNDNIFLRGAILLKLLEDRIVKDGIVKPGNVLKVDSFLNHQMDISLFNDMGKEFKRLFNDTPINKILTIEASGIGIACIAAQYFDNVPVVFAKKSQTVNIDGEVYSTKIESFTHKRVYDVILSKKYLSSKDHVLIIDDFLANGCALNGLLDIAQKPVLLLKASVLRLKRVFNAVANLLGKKVYVSSLLPLLRAWMRIVETSYLRNSDLLFCMIQGESFCS